MADINALIAQGVNPVQIESPINQFAKMQALRAAQQEQQLNALKLQEAQRAMGQQEALRNYLAGATDTGSPEFLGGLTQFGEPGLAIYKALSDAEKAKVELQGKNFENLEKKTNYFRDSLATVNTPEDAQLWTPALYNDPIVGPATIAMGGSLEQALARIPRDPAKFEQWKNQTALGAKKFIEMNKPTLTSQDFGGGIRIVSTPGMGGPATVVPGSTVTKTLTADQRRAQELEGREVARTITDEFGNVTLLNKFGQIIQPTAAAGAGAPATLRAAPSATVQKTQAQQKQLSKDLDTALFELKAASKDGGLIDQSTGSGVGRAVDVGARFIGSATEGDIAIGKLKPIADLVLKLVPRFEGPQSDKDTQSYREAAGQLADPGMPTKIRKEAAKTIIRLMENRKGQFVSNEMANQGVSAASGDVDTSNPLLK